MMNKYDNKGSLTTEETAISTGGCFGAIFVLTILICVIWSAFTGPSKAERKGANEARQRLHHQGYTDADIARMATEQGR